MGNSIRLSEKHGVNPTMGVCFWCGQSTNEIAMLGRLKGDVEAPRQMVLSLTPCDECEAKFSQGSLVIEVEPSNGEVFEIVKGTSPTGRHVVLKEGVIPHKKALMTVADFTQMLANAESEGDTDGN